VDLDLKVEDRLPLHGSVELNNARTVDTDALRLNVSLSYDNLFQAGNSFSFQYQTAPQAPSEIGVYAGTYVFKFGPGYPALAIYAINTNSNVATIGTLDVLGAGDIFGARLVWPISSSATRSDSVSLGVDFKKFRNTINVTTGEVVPTNVNYLPFNVNYSSTLLGGHGTTSLSATFTWALREVVSNAAAFESAREGAPTDFAYLRGSAGRLQELPYGSPRSSSSTVS
jgi:hemolysin activation/secretion protein